MPQLPQSNTRAARTPQILTRVAHTAVELSPFDSAPQRPSSAVQQDKAAPAPVPAPAASDTNPSPEAQAFLTAARARLEGLTRGNGSKSRSGDSSGVSVGRAFALEMPAGAAPAAGRAGTQQEAPPAGSLSGWADHADVSPLTATAVAAAARRRGAAPPAPVLLSHTPRSGAGVSPASLALTPPSLSPTPTPAGGFTPGAAPDTQMPLHRRSSRLRVGGAAVEAETQTTPGMAGAAQQQHVAIGTTPPGSHDAAGPGWGAAFDDDAGAPAAWGGFDDDDAPPPPLPSTVKRVPKRVAGTPNKRLRAAFAARKSLAAAGLTNRPPDGVRRSTRDRIRPLEYWRNETKAYGRSHVSLPTVASVTLRSPEPVWPAPDGWGAKKLAETGVNVAAAAAAAPAAKKGKAAQKTKVRGGQVRKGTAAASGSTPRANGKGKKTRARIVLSDASEEEQEGGDGEGSDSE